MKLFGKRDLEQQPPGTEFTVTPAVHHPIIADSVLRERVLKEIDSAAAAKTPAAKTAARKPAASKSAATPAPPRKPTNPKAPAKKTGGPGSSS